jgi:nuclear transport factor 2 (NTF2) superfamily protein
LRIEGWALYPNSYKSENNNAFSVWLIADTNLLQTRLITDKSFYENANEPQKVIDNYLHRSQWHNKTLFQQCKEKKQKYIILKEETKTDEIVTSILDMYFA